MKCATTLFVETVAVIFWAYLTFEIVTNFELFYWIGELIEEIKGGI